MRRHGTRKRSSEAAEQTTASEAEDARRRSPARHPLESGRETRQRQGVRVALRPEPAHPTRKAAIERLGRLAPLALESLLVDRSLGERRIVGGQLEEERRRKAEAGQQKDGKSLFEVLQQNKSKLDTIFPIPRMVAPGMIELAYG